MENRNIEELANNFVFRYVSNSKHFNINQLIKIIKYPTNDMILDVITRSNKLEPLKFTPLVIDFDVKDEEVFNGFNCDQIINDIKEFTEVNNVKLPTDNRMNMFMNATAMVAYNMAIMQKFKQNQNVIAIKRAAG